MSADQEETTGRSDLQIIADSMSRLREGLDRVERENVPFDRAFVLADDPNDVLTAIHSAVLDFRSLVAAYQREIINQSERSVKLSDEETVKTNLWEQTFYEADVPVNRTIDGQRAGGGHAGYFRHMERHHSHLRSSTDVDSVDDMMTDTVPLSLASLSKWDGWTRRYDVKREYPGVGPVITSRKLRIVIPIAGARRAYEQLRQCLNCIGLLEDVEEDLRPFHDWGEGTEYENGV